MTALGGAFTTIGRVARPGRDPLSTTVRAAAYVPELAYAWVTTTPVPVVVSPKSQVYETIVPSGSYEADASNVTVAPGVAGFGVAVNDATGGRFASAYR